MIYIMNIKNELFSDYWKKIKDMHSPSVVKVKKPVPGLLYRERHVSHCKKLPLYL